MTEVSKPKTDWWKITGQALLVIAALKSVLLVVAIIQSYSNVSNPLIPEYLGHYIAFPYYFLLAFWIVIFLLILNWYRKSTDWKKWVRFAAILVLALNYFQSNIISVINTFNPYG